MQAFHLEHEPPELPDWLASTQQRLFSSWSDTTGHDGACGRGWACEIAHCCRDCDGHVSIPCSLAMEANEIGLFLAESSLREAPPLFLRLLLILLSEFTGGLDQLASRLQLKTLPRPPQVSVWCNRYAKHRMAIHLQHHPLFVFADAYGEAWSEFEHRLPESHFVDRCGVRHPLRLLDYAWLCDQTGARDLNAANDERWPIVVVPPMDSFLQPTIRYFRSFVDACVADFSRIKQYQSFHFNRACL